jgi:hypothetical protein
MTLSVCGTMVEHSGTLVALAQRRCRNKISERDALEPLRGVQVRSLRLARRSIGRQWN